MTVETLIEELKKYPPETRVLVKAYEGGYMDSAVKPMKAVINYRHNVEYMGNHEDYSCFWEGEEELKVYTIEDSLLIKGVIL